MRVLKGMFLAAGVTVAAVSLAGTASAAVVIKSFVGSPFSGLNPLGTLPATLLSTSNTYDFTFDLVAPIVGPSATQAEADLIAKLGSTPELIQYQLYEGTPTMLDPEAGTELAMSALGMSPTLFGHLSVGPYYLNILPAEIAVSGEAISGSFVTTPVPEPVTWGMMLLGVGAIGAAMRIGRRKGETASATA